MKIFENKWLVGVITGLIGSVIAWYLINIKYNFNFIKWWPSGWIFFIGVLLIILIISNVKIMATCLRKKYGSDPNHKLLVSGNKVYLVIDNKIKKWIKNQRTLYELGYDYDQVQRVNRKELDRYKEEKPISVLIWE